MGERARATRTVHIGTGKGARSPLPGRSLQSSPANRLASCFRATRSTASRRDRPVLCPRVAGSTQRCLTSARGGTSRRSPTHPMACSASKATRKQPAGGEVFRLERAAGGSDALCELRVVPGAELACHRAAKVHRLDADHAQRYLRAPRAPRVRARSEVKDMFRRRRAAPGRVPRRVVGGPLLETLLPDARRVPAGGRARVGAHWS